jgi:hypothetical protein
MLVGGMKFRCLTPMPISCIVLPRDVIFTLRHRSKNHSTAIMVKKKELSIDEKPKIQVWTVAGVKTAEIAARLGRGESTIHRLRAELKELPPGALPRLATPFLVVPGPLPMPRMRG